MFGTPQQLPAVPVKDQRRSAALSVRFHSLYAAQFSNCTKNVSKHPCPFNFSGLIHLTLSRDRLRYRLSLQRWNCLCTDKDGLVTTVPFSISRASRATVPVASTKWTVTTSAAASVSSIREISCTIHPIMSYSDLSITLIEPINIICSITSSCIASSKIAFFLQKFWSYDL